jgi:hypothetical protein
LRSNDMHTALELYERSRNAFSQIQDRRGEAQALGRLGRALLREHRITKGIRAVIACFIVAYRAGYLLKVIHRFRQPRPENTEPNPTHASNPALAKLFKTTADARVGIEQS